MPFHTKPLAGFLGLTLLAGCVTTETSDGDMPVSPYGPPFIEGVNPAVTEEAKAACVSALEATTDGRVRIVGGDISHAVTAIYLRVGRNGAPWRCFVSPDGTRPQLMFMGSEGAL